MTDSTHNARFTRNEAGTWLIAVESADAANVTLMVDRRGRGPVRMRTGAMIGPHPKWAGWYCYERLSKAPTGGTMGTNADGTPSNPGGSGGSGDSQGQGQGQGQGSQDNEYVTIPMMAEAFGSYDTAIKGYIAQQSNGGAAREIVVQGTPAGEVRIPGGTHHAALPKILANVAAGIHTYLVGPAGTGKTTLAQGVADALGRELSIMGALMTKHEVTGYCDANGNYVTTAAREAFEHGHLLNLDEIDASAPVAIVAINAMLANERYTFPDRTVTRHPDFCVIACGNTYGTGADREYVGRMQLDAASLDRFAFVEVDYDESLEVALGLAHYRAHHAEGADADCEPAYAFIAQVQTARQHVRERKLRHVVSPRATINGCKLLARGVDLAEVREMVLYKGCADDVRQALGVR